MYVRRAGCSVVPSPHTQVQTLFSTWREHFERFAPELCVQYADRRSRLQGDLSHFDVVVVTQTALVGAFRMGWDWDPKGGEYIDARGANRTCGAWVRSSGHSFFECDYGLVFFDEAHEARNSAAKKKTVRRPPPSGASPSLPACMQHPQTEKRKPTTRCTQVLVGRAVNTLCERAFKTFGMTGTPICNRPSDMAGILYSLNADTPYQDPERWGGTKTKGSIRRSILEAIRPFMDRVRERDVEAVVLPSLTHSMAQLDVMDLPLSTRMQYNRLLSEAQSIVCMHDETGKRDDIQLLRCLGCMSRLLLHERMALNAGESWTSADTDAALASPSPKLLATARIVHEMLQTHAKVRRNKGGGFVAHWRLYSDPRDGTDFH